MGINTDLNVDPYYDDFDEAKQFNRVLFKPAKAVQARELTQLQTILQKQVERFGSNIYKEGTIISGINLTARDDLFYVKLNDKSGFTNPAVYDQIIADDGTSTTFIAKGLTSGLQAEIIKGQNGFQTQEPNLKTFFVKYLNTSQDNATDVKRFLQNEALEILDLNNNVVETVTVNNGENHEGRSFGVSCEEGVIYQKGHFIFVDNQFIIVSKYSNIPGAVSVGFTVKENLIDSDTDTTLLDNASGFNNENAPGADRLQLVPTLASFNTASEPTEFFALIRYVNGKPVRIRDRTEFNVIGNELARRTYEESGNYVTNGMRVTLETEADTAYAVVSPGKAYVYGKEVTNVSSTKLPISPVTVTQSKPGQITGFSYGQYYKYSSHDTNTKVLHDFLLTGGSNARYSLYNNNTLVGKCSIANMTHSSTANSTDTGNIYVYAIVKESGQISTAPNKIGLTGDAANAVPLIKKVSGVESVATSAQPAHLYESNNGAMIFDTGKSSMNSMQNISVTRRVRLSSIGSTSLTLNNNDGSPLNTDLVAITSGNTIETINSANYNNGSVDVVCAGAIDTLYYNRVDTLVPDSLELLTGYVKVVFSGGKAVLGVPNAVKLLNVQDEFGRVINVPTDVTSKFRLVNNQKDGFYDISFLELKAGEEALSNSDLLVKFEYISRSSPIGGGFLTIDSYSDSSFTDKLNLVPNYTAKDASEHNLLNSYDFRPYAQKLVSPSSTTNAPLVIITELLIDARAIIPAVNGTVSSDQTYYMSRVDSVVLDEYSNVRIVKGGESENPSSPTAEGLYTIANIRIPGNTSKITGEEKITVSSLATKTYKMEDIGRIEKRIDALVDIVSLSMLEQETSNLLITDAAGANRFKNGILADSFRDLNLAEIGDAEFKATLDKGRTVVTPAVNQFPLDLKADSGTGVQLSFPDVVTIASTGSNVQVIGQPYATTFRNCVSNFYDYQGKSIIYPPFDSGYDVIKNPEINIEIDIAGPMLDLIDTIQEIIPLTSEEIISEERIGTTRPRRRVIMGQFEQTIEQTSLTSSTTDINQAIGNFVTDVNMKPYLRRKSIQVLITGLRPNTRHYFFFDQKSVDSHVAPATLISHNSGNSSSLDVRNVSTAGWHSSTSNFGKGSPVRADASGTLSAVFVVPAETFFVGENVLEVVDVDQYESIDSASTSYSRATYRGYNFALNKSDVNMTTRTVDFDTKVDIVQREIERQVGDPIAQTFKVKSSSTNDANIALISDIDVYFKQKSATTGVTLQIREVQNGYPSKRVLPFASKHLNSSQVSVSPTGITATKFAFDNPVRLNADTEYSFVVIPDANSPDYLIYTSKVGSTSLSKGTVESSVAVTSDWGDGVLFTSTNDSAWKSYQDEDIKFVVNRYDFATSEASVNLSPNDVEFLTIRDTTLNFEVDEIAYVKKTDVFTASVSGNELNIITIQGSPAISLGDYLHVSNNVGTEYIVAKVVNVETVASTKVFTLDSAFSESTTSATVTLCVAGKVSHFNPRKSNKLFLKESSATSTNYLDDSVPVTIGALQAGTTYTIVDVGSPETTNTHWTDAGVTAGQVAIGTQFVASGSFTAGPGTARPNDQLIQGADSGATAKISTITNEKISYFQPQVYISDSINTSTSLSLLKQNGVVDKSIDKNSNIYTSNNLRTIMSKSYMVSQSVAEDFNIKIDLSNGGFTSASPIIDKDLSELFAYQYNITNTPDTTSTWVTKEVILAEDLDAVGMRVYLAAYRPAGTFIDVYGRFVYPENVEEQGPWLKLRNDSPDLYSNISNTRDYRQFQYNFDEELTASPYDVHTQYKTFQLKFVMRHGDTTSSTELNTPEFSDISPDINLFPHIFDYRAIALT